MIHQHGDAVRLLWQEYERAARQTILARSFRSWQRQVRLYVRQRTREIDRVQRRDRVLRVGILLYDQTRLRRGMDAFRQRVVASRTLDAVVANQRQRNALHKWSRIAWHERMEEQVAAQAWVLHHRRAVKQLLFTLQRWRKRRLCRGLARWQLHVQACRWRMYASTKHQAP
ncbi:hypothetical protein H310_10480 [Aphanomyces invadans]|uniref:Sfi1 spindle body domain-containing protein n=1 Tax=Aphanomyces invadans TaxID=157072 RepID=A0A024TQA3_9STRA|nr:hypothetical protein H310_10480 [Aphanomyces invadans]ETV96315.1 hypothetical protein H310_10480 [Aphanomyces invadans]|eukprot:XP_008875107.1 hypothetical protein H310_10480 [Aphanomyces invadans]